MRPIEPHTNRTEITGLTKDGTAQTVDISSFLNFDGTTKIVTFEVENTSITTQHQCVFKPNGSSIALAWQVAVLDAGNNVGSKQHFTFALDGTTGGDNTLAYIIPNAAVKLYITCEYGGDGVVSFGHNGLGLGPALDLTNDNIFRTIDLDDSGILTTNGDSGNVSAVILHGGEGTATNGKLIYAREVGSSETIPIYKKLKARLSTWFVGVDSSDNFEAMEGSNNKAAPNFANTTKLFAWGYFKSGVHSDGAGKDYSVFGVDGTQDTLADSNSSFTTYDVTTEGEVPTGSDVVLWYSTWYSSSANSQLRGRATDSTDASQGQTKNSTDVHYWALEVDGSDEVEYKWKVANISRFTGYQIEIISALTSVDAKNAFVDAKNVTVDVK